jgi:hypothetical protein
LVLGSTRYRAAAIADLELKRAVSEWGRRMRDPAIAAGGRPSKKHPDRYPALCHLRWDGERCVVVLRAPGGEQFDWEPPEPPPAGLMAYAARVEL